MRFLEQLSIPSFRFHCQPQTFLKIHDRPVAEHFLNFGQTCQRMLHIASPFQFVNWLQISLINRIQMSHELIEV